MTVLVGAAFGALLTVSMLLVLGLAVTANVQNTFSLLNDKAVLATGALERQEVWCVVTDHVPVTGVGCVLTEGVRLSVGRPGIPGSVPSRR